MVTEDAMPKWARRLAAMVAAALAVVVAIVIGGIEIGEGVSGILAAIGALELALPVAHALARRVFDHSDERALDRLRRQIDPSEDEDAEEDLKDE